MTWQKQPLPPYINIYMSFCKSKKHVVEHQKMTANHKKQTSQVNDFSAGHTRVWAQIGILSNLAHELG